MKVGRESLLNLLKTISIGLDPAEGLQQSNAFVFTNGEVVTFNDEILVRAESPLDFDAAIPAEDFKKILTRFPDEEVEISLKGNEVLVKGKRKRAGITSFAEVLLPFDTVPAPKKWSKLGALVSNLLQQAARTCGKDITQPLSTLIHVTEDKIEACDNFRLFRAEIETGFPEEVLLPARAISTLGGRKLVRTSIGKGWAHFKTKSGEKISLRCSHEKYHANMDDLFRMSDAEEVSLPTNLAEMISRAEVMNETGYDAKVGISIEEGQLTITSRKETGWYKEKKRIKYNGDPLEFETHPQFLAEVLQRTRKVLISKGKRLKLEADGIQFVVALSTSSDEEE